MACDPSTLCCTFNSSCCISCEGHSCRTTLRHCSRYQIIDSSRLEHPKAIRHRTHGPSKKSKPACRFLCRDSLCEYVAGKQDNLALDLILSMAFTDFFKVIYSGLYLLCNGLLTIMLVADEWNVFIKRRETLRVSSPRGIQRSSYFLSLPYRFAIPLMMASGTIHWLISQSVFVIQSVGVAYGTSFYRHPAYDSSLVGYSNIGIIYSFSLGSIMIIALVTLGLCNSYRPRKYDEKQETDAQSYTMPLVSSCSAAISAACHRPDEDFESHLLLVRWGFVEGDYWCFTTSRELSYPELEPGTELKVLAATSDDKESHRELQIDVGPAFEVPIGSQELSSSRDGVSIGEQRGGLDDTSALLPRSHIGA